MTAALAALAAISPNGDGVLDATTISAEFRIAGKWGIVADSEKALAESRRTPFYLHVSVAVEGPAGAVRLLTERITVDPVLRPKGTPANGFFIAIPYAGTWDGMTASGGPAPDGLYTLTFSAVLLRGPNGANAGEQALATSDTASALVRVDATPPIIVDLVPAGGSFTNNPAPAIAAAFADAGTGVDPAGGHLAVAGVDVSSAATFTPDSVAYTPTGDLPEGDITVALSISDIAGNVSTAAWSFTEDRTAPLLTLDPPDGAAVSSATPLIVVSYEDPSVGAPPVSGAGLDLSTLQIVLDGAPVAPTSVGASQATYQVPESSPLPNGPHTFTVTLADAVGNVAQAGSAFTVSAGPPPATSLPSEIFSTEQKTFIGNPLPNRFAITVRDADGSPMEGVETSWQITDGTGRLENPLTGEFVEAHSPSGILKVVTDAQGQAVVLYFPFNQSGTTHVVAFLTFFETIPRVEFETEVAPQSPEQFTIVSGNDQTVTPNSPVPLPFVVNLKDPNQNPVPSWGVIFRSESGGGHFQETPGIIGTFTGGQYGEGGLATSATLAFPVEVEIQSITPCSGGEGSLIALSSAHRVVKVDESGVLRSVVGIGSAGFRGDGGPAGEALLNAPSGLAFDAEGNLYVADRTN
ncbi:MAG: hypothetical protein HYY93_04845 [Planctomycetes bacterium]|nr:hypothetical protein [Planctomycetota bacterium]